MSRLPTWDYRAPYHYLVTLKCLPRLPPLSRLDARFPWGIDPNHPLTRALSSTIDQFMRDSPGLSSIKPFILMPDHIHLLVKIKDVPERHSLPKYVALLKGFLRRRYRAETGLDTLLFETEWHDLIVKRSRQLGNFIHYIVNNPHERLLRQSAPSMFHCFRDQRHYRLGERPFDMVGNPELLDEPALVAVRVSRKVVEGTDEWRETLSLYERWKPGMTAVGTWWSKGEQAAFARILARGGSVIRLDPHGFPHRWHPAGEEAQRVCAEGRVLHLSPYPPHTAQLPPGTLRARCLALNDLAKEMESACVAQPTPHTP